MRFLVAAILSISLAAASADAAEPARAKDKAPATAKPEKFEAKAKSGRGKAFLRALGTFGGGVVIPGDQYQEVRSRKKNR